MRKSMRPTKPYLYNRPVINSPQLQQLKLNTALSCQTNFSKICGVLCSKIVATMDCWLFTKINLLKRRPSVLVIPVITGFGFSSRRSSASGLGKKSPSNTGVKSTRPSLFGPKMLSSQDEAGN